MQKGKTSASGMSSGARRRKLVWTAKRCKGMWKAANTLESVNQQVQEAYQIGVTGVPTYVINDRYALVGAQPYEVFKNALAQIMSKTD